MGVWKIQVPVKIDPQTVEQIDRHVARFAPFCDGRSALVRVLIEVALAAIADGTITFDLPSIQRLLRRREGAVTTAVAPIRRMK